MNCLWSNLESNSGKNIMNKLPQYIHFYDLNILNIKLRNQLTDQLDIILWNRLDRNSRLPITDQFKEQLEGQLWDEYNE
jgi:hypothetical protein